MTGPAVLDLLNAGGNFALLAIGWMVWRIERRVVRVETRLDYEGAPKEKRA